MDVSTCFSLAARCQHLKHVVVHTQSKARCKSASTKTENPTMMSFALPSMVYLLRKRWYHQLRCCRVASMTHARSARSASEKEEQHHQHHQHQQQQSQQQEEPLFRFGVIADVQYANRDDAPNFTGSRIRRYRQSKEIWEKSIDWFQKEKVSFIVQLGDFLDGSNRAIKGEGLNALSELLAPLEALDECPPLLNLIGNHELYNFTRKALEEGITVPGCSELFSVAAPEKLLSAVEAPTPRSPYYSFSPCSGWRICVLDPYDVSLVSNGGGRPGIDLGKEELDPVALEMCQTHNPNDVSKENFARGLSPGTESRWVPLNGAISKEQLSWLKETLDFAHERREHTLILSHVILHLSATPRSNGVTLLWNYDEVLSVLRTTETPPVAVLCGHAHLPVHCVDETSGTHHFTLASPLEIEPGGDASTIVEAYADGRIILRGRGSALGESTKTSDGGGSEIDKSQSETIVTVGNHKPNSSSC
eukprot:TRINITY_DN39030_c1_g3_i2.p1 TRINITY_DN39030_c1_g3~~TRINITY_DN39030_c1_g3_i2.p1  ORF type:complete len:489 (+),score=76.49 TRINITY_DN39030_c1_g3_i2:42-1469(+)